MTALRSHAINAFLRFAPARLVDRVRKVHYYRAIRSFWEPDFAIVRELVKPGNYVLDIGANVGWYTKLLSQLVGANGLVYAIEPIPPTFELLCHCVRRLRLTNVRLLNCGVSDAVGHAIMQIPRYDSGGENFYQARIVADSEQDKTLTRFEVEIRTIDSIVAEISRKVHFLKCDVEGHELAVINGALGLIAKSRPACLLEICSNPDRPHSDAHRIFSYFVSQAYKAYWFDGQKLNEHAQGSESVNYFFLTEDHVRGLRAAKVEVRHGRSEISPFIEPANL